MSRNTRQMDFEALGSQENEKPETEYERALEELESMSENGGVTISGRIYRLLSPVEQVSGRPARELVGKVDKFVDDDYIGRKFGSGRYCVRYNVKRDGETKGKEKTFIYTISKEYDKFVKPSIDQAREPEAITPAHNSRAGLLDNFFGSLTVDKITALSLAAKTLKEIFAPPPPPAPDLVGLLQVFAGMREQKPALSDTIVLSAMENLKQQQKQPTILEQIRDLKQIKEELKDDLDDDNDDEGDSNMNILVKSALEYLPILLQQNNNNFNAVGAQAKAIPFVSNIIRKDPELAQIFFEKARDEYGLENAKELAKGFGFEMNLAPETDKEGEIENE